MSMIGYARVSTLEQDPALQHDALTTAGAVRVFTDYASGATAVPGELVFHVFAAVAQMERRLISERTRAGLIAARARGRAGGRPTVMTPERITAAQAMRAQGMTLIQVAATLGVGRSSLVRALAQVPDSPAGPTDASDGPAQTALELPEFDDRPDEPSLTPAPQVLADPEVQLLGRARRRGGEPLEVFAWPAGYSPACPSCAHPTTGLEEQYARVAGIRDLVVVPVAQPCGCLVDGHVVDLHVNAPVSTVLGSGD